MSGVSILHGNCLDVLKTMEDNSIDSVVTDPPYGLSFMGKKWDYDVPSEEIWAECLRVLKPGGHLLAFAGTRTQHRMAVRIEDAGFEIRDMIAWVYGSGFPKSLDVSKALAKNVYVQARDLQGVESEADKYKGWGTALKPALEPITVARKPLIGTVAENVLAHGTGGLNIDGCRVGTSKNVPASPKTAQASAHTVSLPGNQGTSGWDANVGRWPANMIHDGSEEVLVGFPQAPGQQGDLKETGRPRPSSGRFGDMPPPHAHAARIETDKSAARFFYCPKASKKDRDEGLDRFRTVTVFKGTHEGRNLDNPKCHLGGMQSATGKNTHPTVKPTDLMRYLCRLVTPPNGTVLDPFMGSGSTGKAAMLEGFNFIGIEREAEYIEIAKARIEAVRGK